jgi:preprotein translocase subunit SecG
MADLNEAEKAKALKMQRWIYVLMAVFVIAPLVLAYLLKP